MRKLLLLATLLTCPAFVAHAQSSDEYKRLEFFGGFSHNRVDTEGGTGFVGVGERTGFNGFNASVTANVARRVGLKFDASAHFKRESNADFSICVDATTGGVCFTPRARASLYNFLGGVQLKDNATGARLKPFAHLLAGVAHSSVDVDDRVCQEALGFVCLPDQSETGFAGAVGGGLDVRLNDRLDLRVVQLDYNPTRLGGETQHNFRFGVGIVIH